MNTHFLLSVRQSLVACDPLDVRNARNAVIDALPHMLSTMALLWGVVTREECQRRASDSVQSSRHSSTSVYFKSTKVCFTKIFLHSSVPTLMSAMTKCALFMLYVFVGVAHIFLYLAVCIFYYGKLYPMCVDSTSTNTGVSSTSN